MEILDFRTVDELPALYHPELDLLVVSDLHLGLEKTMTFRGNYIPQQQLEKIKQDIKKAREESGASRILINGDLKNEFRTSRAELNEIEELLDLIDELFEDVMVVEGNHDTMIEEIDSDAEFDKLFLLEDILFTHGDEKIKDQDIGNFDTLVIGHEHPSIALEDEIGVREKIDCFLYGKLDEQKIIVMPAFSRIANGTAVNETPRSELISPVLRETELGKLNVVGVSREAGILELAQLEDLRQ